MRSKILITLLIIILCIGTSAFGFLYQMTILDKSAISNLSDEKLLEKYVDVLVEVEASNVFHQTSGFRPRDYESYKNLIRFRINLEQEIKKRKLEKPGFSGSGIVAPKPIEEPKEPKEQGETDATIIK